MLDICIGFIGGMLLSEDISSFGPKVLIPISGILFGVTFAWVGTATALLSDPLVERVIASTREGIAAYIYRFQLSVLISLVTVVSWGIASAELSVNSFGPIFTLVPDEVTNISSEMELYLTELFLFSLSSLCIRISWQTIIGSHALLLSRNVAITQQQNHD